jgi:hypothetical protein
LPAKMLSTPRISTVPCPSGITAEPATTLSKPLRRRDRDHLMFVGAQPCLARGRNPSDSRRAIGIGSTLSCYPSNGFCIDPVVVPVAADEPDMTWRE